MNSDYLGMKAYERRADITKALKAGEKITTRQIREKYGVSKATALRDVSTISRVLPITAEYGAKGGYRYTNRTTVEMSTEAFEALNAIAQANSAIFTAEVAAELERLRKRIAKNKEGR